MKIERISSKQIKCTLTKSDLADRQLKISELAYGSEKAKDLFREMMQQAAFEYGFQADNIPLMIEAIPLNSECIVLIITKVEDPEELDTRFSNFAPAIHKDGDNTNSGFDLKALTAGASDIIDMLKKIKDQALAEIAPKAASDSESGLSSDKKTPASNDFAQAADEQTSVDEIDLTRIYHFSHLNEVIRLAHVLKGYYHGINSLYKDSTDGYYYLVMEKNDHSASEFNKICNIVSEYGGVGFNDGTKDAYLSEHCEIITFGDCLQKFSEI